MYQKKGRRNAEGEEKRQPDACGTRLLEEMRHGISKVKGGKHKGVL